MAEEKKEKETNYLKIDRYGEMYIIVDEGVDGARKVQLKDGSYQYRLYRKYGTIRGHISKVFIKEVDFRSGKVKMLYVFITGEDQIDCLSFQLFSPNGSLTGYVKSIALAVGYLDLKKEYYINASKKLNAKGYVNKNLFITDVEAKEWIRMPKEEFDLIPDAIVKERADGVKTYDFTDQDRYVFKLLETFIEDNFKDDYQGDGSGDIYDRAPKDAPVIKEGEDDDNEDENNNNVPEKPANKDIKDDLVDDLPF